MKKFIFALLSLGVLGACTNPDEAKRTAEAYGFTNVKAGGYALLECGEDDMFSTRFTATNQNGEKVQGVVCSQLIGKGSTVRGLEKVE